MASQEAKDVLKLKVLHYNWSKYPAVPFGDTSEVLVTYRFPHYVFKIANCEST